MSNFGVTYLLKMYKGDKRLSIEDNIGEEIHIHFGEIRLMLKNKEFKSLSQEALFHISEAVDISVDILQKLEPIFLFDLCKRGELPSLSLHEEKYVSVGELLCPVRNMLGIWKYKHICNSHFLKVMKKKTMKTPYDSDQINYFGNDNLSRCVSILEECRKNKDICDEYPLFVTNNNIIRDGQHRAAALYMLYGHDFKVKVQMMETCRSAQLGNEGIKSQLKEIKRLNVSRIKKMIEKCVHSNKNDVKYKHWLEMPINKNAYIELKGDKRLSQEVFFVEKDFALSNFPVLIKKKGKNYSDIAALLKQHGFSLVDGHKAEGVTFIYGLGNDYLITDRDNHPIAFLQEKISSYAMSVNSFMPYAPEIQRYISEFDELPDTILFTLRLLKCMFDKNRKGFFNDDIEWFDKHIELLDKEYFSNGGLIEKVLFGYSDRMVSLLKKRDYAVINEDYRKFEY